MITIFDHSCLPELITSTAHVVHVRYRGLDHNHIPQGTGWTRQTITATRIVHAAVCPFTPDAQIHTAVSIEPVRATTKSTGVLCRQLCWAQKADVLFGVAEIRINEPKQQNGTCKWTRVVRQFVPQGPHAEGIGKVIGNILLILLVPNGSL